MMIAVSEKYALEVGSPTPINVSQRCFSNSLLRFGALFGTVLSSRATPFVFSASTVPAALVSAHHFPQIPQIRGA